MEYYSFLSSPLGRLTLASDGEAITGLWFEGQRFYAKGLSEAAAERSLPVFGEAERWLARYFSGEEPGPLPLLRPRGTEFQQRVWARLLAIGRGETRSYGALAWELGSSGRAVGAAVGRNPISILIPCHRVLGADGSLTGYAGGLERKKALLRLEGRSIS